MQSELQALRRSLRRTQLALGACLGLMLLAAAGPTSLVRAERFELVNARGEVVGTWTQAGLDLGEGELTTRGAPMSLQAPVSAPPAAAPVAVGPGGVELRLEASLSYSSVEVVCPSGFRDRAPFVGGVARFADVPGASCKAVFKGGAPAKVVVGKGDRLTCSMSGEMLRCE